jgi:hypothetical protein
MMMMMMRGDPIYRFFAIIFKEEVSAAEKKKNHTGLLNLGLLLIECTVKVFPYNKVLRYVVITDPLVIN